MVDYEGLIERIPGRPTKSNSNAFFFTIQELLREFRKIKLTTIETTMHREYAAPSIPNTGWRFLKRIKKTSLTNPKQHFEEVANVTIARRQATSLKIVRPKRKVASS